MDNNIIERIAEIQPVSDEQIKKLDAYVALLLKWNKSINLIGKATETDIWSRHILDAAQLLPLIPKGTKVLTDFGSGAGIPAIILSILASHEHIEHIHVVESVGKKTNFMKQAARTLKLPMTVHNGRIEAIEPWACDVITARAFAPLPSLLNYVQPFFHQKDEKDTLCVLPKGCRVRQEIEDANTDWQFDYTLHDSIVTQKDAGFVLTLTGVKRINATQPKL